MPIIKKDDPKGIDVPLAILQKLLFDNVTWNNSPNTYVSYERAYKNATIDNKLPEVYTGNNEYIEVFTDDSVPASSFFLASDNREVGDRIAADIDIIFQLDLNKLYPNIAHRADEEAHKQVLDVLERTTLVKINSLQTGIANVYSCLLVD